MRTVILNGADPDTPEVDALCAEVERQLAAQPGASVRTFHLRHLPVGHCLGDFDCWVTHPGRCRIDDEGQAIERAVHDADRMVWVTPVVFGGHGPQLKKACDRLLPLVTPFFERRAGATHHVPRYARMPRLVALGWDATPSPAREALFARLMAANALNLGLAGWSAAVVGGPAADAAHTVDVVAHALATSTPADAPGVAAEDAERALLAVMTADPSPTASASSPVVAVLMASPRGTGTSTSESLATDLGARLAGAGATVHVVRATECVRGAAEAERAARRLAEADVLVVATPMYIDTLPYPGLLALQHVARNRRADPRRRPCRVVALVNCGFPEAVQMRGLLAVLRGFADEAGCTWAGALPVGGGEAIHGRPLAETGGMTTRLRAALEATATFLAAGGAVPPEASLAAARPFLPAPLYRLVGTWGWRRRARAHGLRQRALRDRPFDAPDAAERDRLAGVGGVRARVLRVVAKVPEGPDAVTLVLDDPARHPLAFEAGQVLTLELPIDGDRVRRAYSLSSSPCEGVWSVTVKRVPGGLASNWIHDRLAEGTLLRAFGPSGTFTAGPRPPDGPRRLLLVAGGSGIVPLAAIAHEVLHAEADAEVALVFGAASLDRAILAPALLDLAREHDTRLHLRFVFERPPPGWDGPVGRLDAANLGRCLAGLPLPAFQRAMLCGPDAQRAVARDTLVGLGLPRERIAEEAFVSPRRACVPAEAQAATLVDDAGAHDFTVPGDRTLLEAALDAGLAIGFSCCSGGCGACRVRITAHPEHVVLDEPNDVPDDDRARGHVPACLARLRGPVTFTLP